MTDETQQRIISEWQERLHTARERRQPVRIRGGGSKSHLPWCGIPDDALVIDTRALRGVERYEPTELVVTVRGGTPLAEVEALLAERNQWLPFAPPRFHAGTTIGGVVASGLSGPTRLGHGTVRDAVLGVRLLDGRGRVLRFGGEVMKNVAGYDVSRLLVGSWGTLGVLLSVSLKVAPVPPASATRRFAMTAVEASRQLNRWAGQPLPLSAALWADGTLWVQLRGARAAVEEAGCSSGARRWQTMKPTRCGSVCATTTKRFGRFPTAWCCGAWRYRQRRRSPRLVPVSGSKARAAFAGWSRRRTGMGSRMPRNWAAGRGGGKERRRRAG